MNQFQIDVCEWMMECFGRTPVDNVEERCHRFLEEALELAQASGCTADHAHELVDYVYGRPVGVPRQEVGGTMLTLAGLCTAMGIDMDEASNAELSRVYTKLEEIRIKQANKPAFGPLPQ